MAPPAAANPSENGNMENNFVDLTAFKRKKDAARAESADTVFFNKHPDRMFRIRPAIGLEKLPNAEGLPANTACLVQVDRTAKCAHRFTLPINLEVLPDDDAFLIRLWMRIKETKIENRLEIIISPEEHRQWLIDTGHWQEPADG